MIGFQEHQNPIPSHSHFVQLYHFHLYMMCSSWMKIQADEFFLNAFQPPQLFCCQSRCCFSRSSCSLYPLPQHRTPLLNREPESPSFTSPHQLSPSRFTMDRPAMFPDMPPRSTSQLLPIFPLLSQLCNDDLCLPRTASVIGQLAHEPAPTNDLDQLSPTTLVLRKYIGR